jgi:hypothetical protein
MVAVYANVARVGADRAEADNRTSSSSIGATKVETRGSGARTVVCVSYVLDQLCLALALVAGVWGARLSWEQRLGAAHTLALGTVDTMTLV